ncbi:MAG: hypothetical protein V1703_00190 [Candidatus Altiarchaeota archaeon]
MREDFIKKVAEAGRVLWGIKLFELAMNAIVCFLFFAVIMTIAHWSIYLSLIPTVLYVVIALSKRALQSDVVGTIEKKTGRLQERLKTAYDNKNKENIIVSSLISDVSGEMDNMEASSFMNQRRVSYKVVASIALIFLILVLTVIDLRWILANTFDFDMMMRSITNAMKERGIQYERAVGGEDRWEGSNLTTESEKEKLGAEPGGERPGFQMGPIPGGGGGVGSDDRADIYGKASSAAIEGENVDFNLRPDYGGEVEIKNDNEDEQQVNAINPEGVESADTCDECAIGPEHEDLVKRYFEKILGEV